MEHCRQPHAATSLGDECAAEVCVCLCFMCCALQDPQVQEAVAELQQRKQLLDDVQARYKAALAEAEAAAAAPPTMETVEEDEVAQ